MLNTVVYAKRIHGFFLLFIFVFLMIHNINKFLSIHHPFYGDNSRKWDKLRSGSNELHMRRIEL